MLEKLLSVRLGMHLVIPTVVRSELLVLQPGLLVKELLGRVVVTCLVGGAVAEPHGLDRRQQLRLARREIHSPVQQRRQTLKGAEVVAQLVILKDLDDLLVARQVLGRDDVLELAVRHELAGEPTHIYLEPAGRLAGRPRDEGRLEDPALHPADHVGLVLLVAGQRQHLAATHRVAHDEHGQVAAVVEEGLDEGNYVGEDHGRRARLAAVGRGLDGPAPAALVKAVHGNAAIGYGVAKVIIQVDVVREAMDQDQLRLGSSIGLENRGVQSRLVFHLPQC